MNFKHLFIKLIVIFISLITQIIAQSGTVNTDINFTTHKGENHNLFDLLNSGKHVFLGVYTYGG